VAVMAEVNQVTFKIRELTEVLIRHLELKDGYWVLYVEFGIGGANISPNEDLSESLPAAIVPIQKVGLRRVDELTPMAVDAASIAVPGADAKRGRRAREKAK
jgi:hypothetical protein